jgi:SAM-dependent methyltransferase
MIDWLSKNNYLKKEIFIDSYKYETYLKKKTAAPLDFPRLVIVSYQPNKDTSALLELCIRSIQKFTDTGYELWVVDNNSPEGNIKWLDSVKDINIVYVRTNPRENSGSYANALALEIAIKLIDPGTKYFMSLHEDTVVCRYGWLKYLLSKFDDKTKAVGFRLTKARVPDGVLHVCGCMIDFQFFKKQSLSFLPQLPYFDVGDKAICEIKREGFKIFNTPNTFDDESLVELIPKTLAVRNLNVTRSFNDKNEVVYMHLGRGVPKAKKIYDNQKKCSLEEWSKYIRSRLLSEPDLLLIGEEKLKNEDFSNLSITEFYVLNFFEENLNLLSDKSKILYFGEKRKILDRYDFNSDKYSGKATYGSCSFDCIIFSEVMKYLNGLEDLLGKFYKLLSSGGILLITVPFMTGDDIQNLDSFKYSREWISDKLWQIGFREVSVKKLGSYYSILLYLEYKKFELRLKDMDRKKAAVLKDKFLKKKLKKVLMFESKLRYDRKFKLDINMTGYGIAAIK